jgi:hypothetical protein
MKGETVKVVPADSFGLIDIADFDKLTRQNRLFL